MSWGAVAVGGAALVGSYISSTNAANAAAGAASDQLSMAYDNRRMALNFAQASPQELNMLSLQSDAATKNLARQQKLIDSVDPALMEASKQALQILQGGTAASTQPMFAMRNRQRSNLVTSLRSQFGPGAETTSVGQRALERFDLDTQNMQSGSLNQLLGIAGDNSFNAGLNSNLGVLAGVGQGYGNIQSRQANAAIGTGSQLYDSAGASHVGDALKAQGLQSLSNNALGLASTYGMYNAMRPQPNSSAVRPGVSSGANPAAGFQGSSFFGGDNPYAG